MNKPHKHAALIKAWADGAEIQVRSDVSVWMDVAEPTWKEVWHYRIKPEPKADVVLSRPIVLDGNKILGRFQTMGMKDNVKFTFDGETNELKAVELIS